MRTFLLAALALAGAATTTDVFTSETGQREGRIVEGPSGSMDLFGKDSQRLGWGRQNPDGSRELFAPDGRRLGTISRDGKLWLNRAAPKGGGKR